MYLVAVQAPYSQKDLKKVWLELKEIAHKEEVWLDIEFLLKIQESDWDKIVEICEKYLLNGTVLQQVKDEI